MSYSDPLPICITWSINPWSTGETDEPQPYKMATKNIDVIFFIFI